MKLSLLGYTLEIYREKAPVKHFTQKKAETYKKVKGVNFRVLNNGAHLQNEHYDYWPSTELWINRKTKVRGYCISQLIADARRNGVNILGVGGS